MEAAPQQQVGGAPNEADQQRLKIDKFSDGALVCLKFVGTVDESFDGKKMAASVRAGTPVTLPETRSIADGLLPVRPGDLTFSIVQRFAVEVVTVTDDAIREAARIVLEGDHLLTEWSGAASVAALLSGAIPTSSSPVVAVLSGGNADPQAILAPIPGTA